MVRVLFEDSVYTMAKKIFTEFEIHQSCTIAGWAEGEEPGVIKGELVLKELERLDRLENTYKGSDKRIRRKRVVEPDSIGGYVAQKMFKYRKNFLDSEPRIVIWRAQ